ncbi:hypothetical protein AKJ09_02254 [Labilithrix luteola]|uniref:Uncharacterized protein n=1 Tax=Labilithrix luteola TaxID=1391654 RepID=A0A0K1PPX2_9BACT|nr:hypothetical protein AKJ09_02254 [Labilithrix luteola]
MLESIVHAEQDSAKMVRRPGALPSRRQGHFFRSHLQRMLWAAAASFIGSSRQ